MLFIVEYAQTEWQQKLVSGGLWSVESEV